VGFIFTAVYIIATIISPDQFGPQWAKYHAVQYLAGATFLSSLPAIYGRRRFFSSIQTFLMLGFIFAIGFSAIANGWIGGAIASWQVFLPSAAVFFFIVANVTTVRRLRILTAVVAASCLTVVVEALCGYYLGFRSNIFVLQENLYSSDDVIGHFARLRGAGFLNDPNDFAQMLLIMLPLLVFAWQRGRKIENALFVLAPAALLLWAVYLTHSRGGLIALAILALMIGQRKMGAVTSAALIAVLILGLMALDFTGGRGISAMDGADRLEAWASGLEMFKRAPLFGIGFGAFTDFDNITAHNSFVLCLAELGLVGTTLWVALVVTTMTSLNRIISQNQMKIKQTASAPGRSKDGFTFFASLPDSVTSPSVAEGATADSEDIEKPIEADRWFNLPHHWLLAMRLSLVGFIATSWFLSRSYSTPMYLLLGLATAMVALQEPAPKSIIRSRWLFVTLGAEAAALICVYGMVYLRN
jgi:O-antigen ligase